MKSAAIERQARKLPAKGVDGLEPRVRKMLSGVRNVEEKKMFGSTGFMVNGKLCISARDSRIMCKVDPGLRDDLLARKGVRPMTMKGREHKGYVFVDQSALKSEKDLRFWVDLALDFNAKNTGR